MIYNKTYVNISNIQKLFSVDYYTAKQLMKKAKLLHNPDYFYLENRVLLESVLEAIGIKDKSFWLSQHFNVNESEFGDGKI